MKKFKREQQQSKAISGIYQQKSTHTHRTEMKETDTRTVMDKKETDTGREKEKARAKDESI